MNTSALPQTIGNLCAGLATLIFLLPLQHLMWDYARKQLNNDQWVTPILFILIPLWLLLMGALLSVTASGGFDWLPLGRPLLHALTVAATFALAVVSFVSIALYIRPGFTPRSLYCPLIYLVPFATVLLVVLSLNPKLTSGLSMHWLHLPWTIFAALSLVASVGFFGYRTLRIGVDGVIGIAHLIRNPSPSSEAILAQIPNLYPQRDFADLLRRTGPGESRAVREAVVARLRTNPEFIKTLTATLNSREPSNGLGFLQQSRMRLRSRRAAPLNVSPARSPRPTTCRPTVVNNCCAGDAKHFPLSSRNSQARTLISPRLCPPSNMLCTPMTLASDDPPIHLSSRTGSRADTGEPCRFLDLCAA